MAWRKVQIKELLTPRGKRYKPDDTAISDMPRIEKIDFTGKIFISDKPSKTGMIVVQPGDFVISGINVAKGAMAVYQGDVPVKATIHYSSYEVDHNIINLEYFRRFLKSPVFLRLLKEQVPGGIKTEIKPKHLLPLTIDLPDIAEQESVLSWFLNTENKHAELMSEIDNQKNLVSKLRQAILQEAIQGKLTEDWRKENPDVEPAGELLKRIAAEKAELVKAKKIRKQKPLPSISDDEIPFDIPETWEWCRAVDSAVCHVDCPHDTPKYMSEGIPCLRAPDVISTGLKLDAVRYVSPGEYERRIKRLTPKKFDFVYIREGGRLGIGGLIDVDYPVCLGQRVMLLRFLSETCARYAASFFNSPTTFHTLTDKVIGAASPHLNVRDIIAIPIAIPPLAEQREIVNRVEAKLALCDKLEAEVTAAEHHAKNLSAAILQEVFDQQE